MRITFKIIGSFILAIAVLAGLFVGYMTVGRGTTPQLPGTNSIAALETWSVGGVNQSVLIRGADRTQPVLLWLHGGPGEPEMRLRAYQQEWEKHFVVVNWDQRGAGKSYSDQINPDSLNMEQFIADSHEIVETLKTRFHTEKIYLAGHSWGTVLGVKLAERYPNDFYAYIGTGQVVDIIEGMNISYHFAMDEARKENNRSAISSLEKLKEPDVSLGTENLTIWGTVVNWVSAFHGSHFHDHNVKLVLQMLRAPEYSLSDWIARSKGASLIAQSKVYPEMLDVHFLEQVHELKVPVFLCQGTHDYHTPLKLVEQFYDQLKAPQKRLILFTESAHSPNVEEEDKFAAALLKIKQDTFH